MGSQQFAAVLAQRSVGSNVPIKRLTGDAEFSAKRADLGFRLTHCRLRQSEFAGGHLERRTAVTPARTSRHKARLRPFGDERSLELGERGKDTEHQLSRRRGRVDGGALTGEYLQADLASGQIVHQVDEMAQIAPQPVQLPDDERIARAKRLEAGDKAGAVVPPPGGEVFVEMVRGHPGGGQGVALQVEDLGAVGLGDAGVADQHGSECSINDRLRSRQLLALTCVHSNLISRHVFNVK
jgi:hypothetical protein